MAEQKSSCGCGCTLKKDAAKAPVTKEKAQEAKESK